MGGFLFEIEGLAPKRVVSSILKLKRPQVVFLHPFGTPFCR
jgi:hypothetical protein